MKRPFFFLIKTCLILVGWKVEVRYQSERTYFQSRVSHNCGLRWWTFLVNKSLWVGTDECQWRVNSNELSITADGCVWSRKALTGLGMSWRNIRKCNSMSKPHGYCSIKWYIGTAFIIASLCPRSSLQQLNALPLIEKDSGYYYRKTLLHVNKLVDFN